MCSGVDSKEYKANRAWRIPWSSAENMLVPGVSLQEPEKFLSGQK